MSFNNNPAPLFEEDSSPFKNAMALFKEEIVSPTFEEEVEAFKKTTLFENMA